MYNFTFHRPGTVAAAAELKSIHDEATYMAGGQTLLPVMKQRLAAPSDVIDLTGLTDLTGISVEGDVLRIGALTPHADVAASTEVKRFLPALAYLAHQIGDPHVRNRGTIGGSLANNDPASDYAAGVLGLGATITTDQREIPADSFFTGMFETALSESELVTSVSFPRPQRAGYAKFPNPASRYPIVGVFVARLDDHVRVAVTGAGGCVFRVRGMEAALTAEFSPSALDGVSVPAEDLNSDLHATPEYRAHLVGVMARRAVEQAL